MNRTVIVRYGEIAIKSKPVRKKFEKILVENIKTAITETSFEIETERGRIFIDTSETEKVASSVANLPGVVSTSPAWKAEPSSLEGICNFAEKIARRSFSPKGSFAIRSRRMGDHEFSSEDIEEKVGERVLEEIPDLSVNLDSPDQTLYIEIRGGDAYFFTKVIEGIGGLPVGSQKKIIVLFSGNIYSAISTVLLLKRGALACPLFFDTGDEKLRKEALALFKEILKFHPKLELRTVNIQSILEQIPKKVSEELKDMVKERMLIKLAEAIGGKIDAKALASSKSSKQIATLTLHNLGSIEERTDIPVFHPLLGYENEKLAKIGKKINPELPDDEFRKPPSSSKMEKIDPEKIHEIERKIPQESLIESALETLQIYTFFEG
ncbi:hypothetical protein AKJ37_07030 [candidate division MSBL1 archaeon SCGC-AAA259I09]|uniref:Probable tRNA sulfurtransferase n=2 Tax=candidate division MSBL1 TaxID=215777 RepID=A0A133UM37_9EURY|nr:hypothetical protein AKJ37_07030 [candidate division MSBL1 archaeon SCGC-AAA259I09]KXA98858.1 hypothetical protein AKJ39_00400 [candidate division MSBL1 archaeon SCGC-AAA259J03]